MPNLCHGGGEGALAAAAPILRQPIVLHHGVRCARNDHRCLCLCFTRNARHVREGLCAQYNNIVKVLLMSAGYFVRDENHHISVPFKHSPCSTR